MAVIYYNGLETREIALDAVPPVERHTVPPIDIEPLEGALARSLDFLNTHITLEITILDVCPDAVGTILRKR